MEFSSFQEYPQAVPIIGSLNSFDIGPRFDEVLAPCHDTSFTSLVFGLLVRGNSSASTLGLAARMHLPLTFLEFLDERRNLPRRSSVRFLVHQEIPAASELEPIQDVPNTHGFDFSESSMVEAFTFRVATENRL